MTKGVKLSNQLREHVKRCREIGLDEARPALIEKAIKCIENLGAENERLRGALKNVSDECAGVIALFRTSDLEDQAVRAALKPIKQTVDATLSTEPARRG